MNLQYVIAHDVGTSSCKTVLVDATGNVICKDSNSYPVSIPKPNWVEQNPEDYYQATIQGTKNVLEMSQI